MLVFGLGLLNFFENLTGLFRGRIGRLSIVLLERVQSAEVLFRMSRDKQYIRTPCYASAIQLTVSVGKQATAWRKRFSPVA